MTARRWVCCTGRAELRGNVVARLPTGTLTFLFTDLQGSTRLWEQHPRAMASALARHDQILNDTIVGRGGSVVKSTGDGLYAVFPETGEGLRAVVEAQRALATEDWAVPEPLRVRMALHTGQAELRAGDYFGTAVNRAARLAAVAHGGQVVLSGTTERLVRDDLPVGVELVDLGQHRLRDLERPERVFQVVADGLQRNFPRLKSVDAGSTNLPVQLTSFVGRQDELKALAELLDSARLVSLVGSGGCGKTRLAVQVASEVLDRFEDGVWFVDLAGVRDPELVAQTVATALGQREEVGRSYTETLLSYLDHRQTLVVLDNCEQLIQACAELADGLLHGCPSLRMIATTREPLGVPGEVTWRVPSLVVPAHDTPVAPDLIADYAALRLFFDRAERARPGFAVTERVTEVAAEICRRLDGIPLAIELAAARVRMLAIDDVLAGLTDQLNLLAGGPRTAVPRHRTIAASIEWSHDLLTEPEQVLFRRLSVFSAGFDLEAAEQVCAGTPVERGEVRTILGGLVDRSLVLMNDERGTSRFGLLETIRQFGADQLFRSDEAAAARTRHLEYFVGFAERAAPMLEGPAEGEWMDRLELDHNNLRAALDWSLADQVELGLRLAAALHYFWYVRGHYTEGARWFERLFERATPVAPNVRADALYGDSYLTGWGLGRFAAVIPRLEECAALAREAGDPRRAGRALWALGTLLTSQQPAVAAANLEEAIELARQAGDTWCLSSSLSFLGTSRFSSQGRTPAFPCYEEALAVARRGEHLTVLVATLGSYGTAALALGDYPLAEAMLTECLTLARQVGHRLWTATSLAILSQLATRRGHSEESRRLAEEALAAAEESSSALSQMGAKGALGWCALGAGDPATAASYYEAAAEAARAMPAPPYIAVFLANLGEARLALGEMEAAAEAIDADQELARVSRPLTQAQLLNLKGRLARADGDLAGARQLLLEALQLCEFMGDPQGQADSLEDLAGVAADEGSFEQAARLLGAGQAVHDRIGYVRFPHRQAIQEADRDLVSRSLDPEAFEAAFTQAGRAGSDRVLPADGDPAA